MNELRQALGNAIRSHRLPSWLLFTAQGCYTEVGRLASTVARPDDPAVITAMARAETVLDVCGIAPPTGAHAMVSADPPAPTVAPSPPRPAGLTILLVEDDIDVRLSVREILVEEGYRVVAPRDGLEALSVLEHLQPSLILLDLMMPRVNGWELVKRLKADPRWASIPVCVISAFTDLRAPDRIVAALRKPLDLNTLVATVAAYARPVASAQQ